MPRAPDESVFISDFFNSTNNGASYQKNHLNETIRLTWSKELSHMMVLKNEILVLV